LEQLIIDGADSLSEVEPGRFVSAGIQQLLS
jgi:hypothetical protein